MKKATKKRLETDGWKFGSAADFLGLSDEESAYLELKLRLSEELRTRRSQGRLSQSGLAKRIGSSQSRVAKMEASDPTVSVDLLVKGLIAAGATRQDIGAALTGKRSARSSQSRKSKTSS